MAPGPEGPQPGLVPVPPGAGEFTHAGLVAAVAAMVRDDPAVTAEGSSAGEAAEPGEWQEPADRSQPARRPGPVALPPQLDRRGLRGAIVLVLDGLGWHQLLATDAAPWLADVARDQPRPSRAVVPSTTSSNLVSIGTGRASGEHGILGYTMLWGSDVFNTLTWRIGLRGGGADVRDSIVPEALVPAPTMFERLPTEGIATTVVLHPGFLDSGLTRAGLRGGQRLAASGLADALGRARDAVLTADGPAVAYAHHGTVDTAGHVDGPHTPAWREALGEADRVIADFVASLPGDVALVITADHGMVAIDERDVFELRDGHPLLAGVGAVAGEPRLRTLQLDGSVDIDVVVGRFAEALGDRAAVVPTAEAVAAGWFGPTAAAHRRRLGDVLLVSHRGTVPHVRVDPRGGRLAGLHGGITAAERDVPLLVVSG